MNKFERRIPVIRHGQFEGPGLSNRDFPNFTASLTDESKTYPLTELGKSQILQAMRQIPNYRQTDLIITSEFLRTQESAQVIASEVEVETGRAIEIAVSPLLNTIWMPPDSLKEEEFMRLEQDGKNSVANEMFRKWAGGNTGETPKMVNSRIGAFLTFLSKVVQEKPSAQPIVITHASLASALLRHAQGENLNTPRNEEQILKVAGYYYLVTDKDQSSEILGIDLSKEKFLA